MDQHIVRLLVIAHIIKERFIISQEDIVLHNTHSQTIITDVLLSAAVELITHNRQEDKDTRLQHVQLAEVISEVAVKKKSISFEVLF